jgi:hypothetical protein
MFFVKISIGIDQTSRQISKTYKSEEGKHGSLAIPFQSMFLALNLLLKIPFL